MNAKIQKKCVDCMYYLASHMKCDSGCLKFGGKYLNVFEKAENVRKDPMKCGPDAKSFISKFLK